MTLVFCDVAGSTPLGERLDPEALRNVWSRYHETAREVLERHGGTVEKFVGDAVMAVFGIPVVHEDDALRAVRAAVELRDAFARLNDELAAAYGVRLEIRTGVNTGAVIAGDPSQGQAFATGDAVVVAQRLEAQAAGGEILVGDTTIRLVRDAVTAELLPPLELRGKAEPVTAWRLLAVAAGPGPERPFDAPLVGRLRELERLREELAKAQEERSCRVLTVVGEPGVGKSRLASELAATLGGDARLLQGRCLPYGRGITYWPLAEIVRALADGDAPEAALRRVLGDGGDAETVRARVLEAVGLAPSGSRTDELHLAVRRLFEALARERPLVVVLDDVQWAEPAFLDLVDYLGGWSHDAPMLLLCLARTDVAELRPSWASRPTILLEPLATEETRRLLDGLAGPLAPAAAHSLARASGGNPLFAEEIVRMLVEQGLLAEVSGRLEPTVPLDSLPVPATLEAVLAARLDRLEPVERAVLERAAVVGELFWWGAVAELAQPEEVGEVAAPLHALVRKGLIRPDPRTFAGEDGFRFGHLLVRDTAYAAMPKELRARLHERLADWIAARAKGVEHDELVGHHLELALRYRAELAPGVAADAPLAVRAGSLLAAAGRRALARDDAAAAAGLLRRAAELRPDDAALLVDLGEALFALGRFAEAEEANAAAVAAAAAAGDSRSGVAAELSNALIGLLVRDEGGVGELAARVDEALPAFEEEGDDATVARLLTHLADAYWWRCRIGPMEQALERALRHARTLEDARERAGITMRLAFAAVSGPLPVAQGRRRLDELLEETLPDTSVHGAILVASGLLASMAGDEADARRLCDEGVATLEALGRTAGLAAFRTWTAAVHLNAGDAAAAERDVAGALAQLQELGERANLASVAAELAEALCAQGRWRDALAATETSEGMASPDDLHAQIAWRTARAKALAGLGDGAAAEAVAAEAVALAGETDSPSFAGDALLALATAHAAAGQDEACRARAEEARSLYAAKGHAVAAARAAALSRSPAAARTGSPAA